MSDQLAVNNQARPSNAVAPVLLTATGAGLGAAFSPFLQKGCKSYEELLANMDNDTFESVKTTAAKDKFKSNQEVQEALNRLTTERTAFANIDNLVAEKLKNDNGLEKLFEEYEVSKENQKIVKDAIKDAEEVLTKAKNGNMSEETIKTAQEAYNKKVAETLKEIAAKKHVADKADDVAKDFGHLRKILPKNRLLGGIVFGAVGMLVGGIIAKVIANKRNQA